MKFPNPVNEYLKVSLPAFADPGRWWLHVGFRFSFIILGLFIAQQLGEMVTSASRGQQIREILSAAGWGVSGILTSIAALVLVMRFQAAWPNMEARISRNVRTKTLRNYFWKSPAEVESIGKTVAVFESGTWSWARLASQFAIEIPINAASFGVVLVYVFILDAKLFLSALVYVATIWPVLSWMEKKISPQKKRRTKINEERSRRFVRGILEKETATVYGCQKEELDRATRMEEEMVSVQDSISIIQLPLLRVPQYLLDVAKISAVCLVSVGVAKWTGQAGDAVAVGMAFWFLDKHFQWLLDSYHVCSNEWTNYRRLVDFLINVPELKNYGTGKPYEQGGWRFSLCGIKVRYSANGKEILNWITTVIEKWTTTAIIWKSWAGKTTFLRTIMGFVEPSEWEVFVDGQLLSGMDLESFYKNVGYLSQEPRIFEGSIRENVAYGFRGTLSDEQIESSLDAAECDFVKELPNGLDEIVGEKWASLSGWQRQRLAIARIILRQPSILILDEPTSALDQETEKKVMRMIRRLFDRKTVIIVSHRPETALYANKILVMDSWRVIEENHR